MFANNKDTDKSALACSLISAFVIHLHKLNLNFLASLWSWRVWFESRFGRNPADRLCHVEVHTWGKVGNEIQYDKDGEWSESNIDNVKSQDHVLIFFLSHIWIIHAYMSSCRLPKTVDYILERNLMKCQQIKTAVFTFTGQNWSYLSRMSDINMNNYSRILFIQSPRD